MEIPPIEELLGNELYDKVKNLAGLATLQLDLPDEALNHMESELKKGKLTMDDGRGYRWYVLAIVPTEEEGSYWVPAIQMGQIN